MRDSQNYPFYGPKPIFGLQMGPIKVPRPVPGSIFHETDTRNLKKGVPGRSGAKFPDFGVGGSGAHFPRIWHCMPDPFFPVVPPLRRNRPAHIANTAGHENNIVFGHAGQLFITSNQDSKAITVFWLVLAFSCRYKHLFKKPCSYTALLSICTCAEAAAISSNHDQRSPRILCDDIIHDV